MLTGALSTLSRDTKIILKQSRVLTNIKATTTRWLMPALNLLIQCYYNFFCFPFSPFSSHSRLDSISCCRVELCCSSSTRYSLWFLTHNLATIGFGLSTYVECLWGAFFARLCCFSPLISDISYFMPVIFSFSYISFDSFPSSSSSTSSVRRFLRNFYLHFLFSPLFCCLTGTNNRPKKKPIFNLAMVRVSRRSPATRFVCFAS